MKRNILRDYAPIFFALFCAAAVGTLLLTGVLDLDEIPALVRDNRLLAVTVALALFAVKGLSGVILYNALILLVALLFPLWEALIINAVGTALALSVSYTIGRFTKTKSLEQILQKHEKINKYFRTAREYGFVFCFSIHVLGINMEVLGILLGMLRIGFVKYLVSSWLGIVPGMIAIVIAGNERSVRNPAFWIILGIDLLLIGLGFLYMRRKAKAAETADT